MTGLLSHLEKFLLSYTFLLEKTTVYVISHYGLYEAIKLNIALFDI